VGTDSSEYNFLMLYFIGINTGGLEGVATRRFWDGVCWICLKYYYIL